MAKVTELASDLEAKNLFIVGNKNGDDSEPVVVYTNVFKGKSYFHIRSVYQDKYGRWAPGKGLAVDPANAKALLKSLGEAAEKV